MKVRDSGMPEETMWLKFFDPELILRQMDVTNDLDSVVDLGSGFGTFSIPASQLIQGEVHAFDIEPDMILHLQTKMDQLEIKNITLHLKDFIKEGTGLDNNSIDYVMLFNLLHHDKPHQILNEIFRVLKPGGKAGIIHWRRDIATPRGPHLDFRPSPEECKQWAAASGFSLTKELILEPYHFGILITKL
jgi:ubiquinone/menaquinone biosynthesis C-methylase UbiE